jgi:hypothetical protein
MFDKIKKLIIAVEKKRSSDWNKMVTEIARLSESVVEIGEQNRLLEKRIVVLTKRTLNESKAKASKRTEVSPPKRRKSAIDTGDSVLNEVLNSTKPIPSDGPGVNQGDEKVSSAELNSLGIMKDYRNVMKAIDTKQQFKRNADQ